MKTIEGYKRGRKPVYQWDKLPVGDVRDFPVAGLDEKKRASLRSSLLGSARRAGYLLTTTRTENPDFIRVKMRGKLNKINLQYSTFC